MAAENPLTLAAALKTLGAAQGELPDYELCWLRDQWDVAAPALTQVLARFARDPEKASDPDALIAWFALFLLAEHRETSAMPLLRILLKTPDGAGSIFADDGSMALSRIIISLFDGDLEGLQAVVEYPKVDAFIREVTLEAMGYLAAAGATDRAAFESWLATVPEKLSTHDDTDGAMLAWGFVVARLGMVKSVEIAKQALESMGDEDGVAGDELDILCQMAREDSDPLAAFTRDGIEPVDDALADLHRVGEIQEALEAAMEDEDEDIVAPEVNLHRDVGRNDPCPCGSGKKFKKCCLAA